MNVKMSYCQHVMQSLIKKFPDDNWQVTSMGQESLTGFEPMTSYYKPSEANLHNEAGQPTCCHSVKQGAIPCINNNNNCSRAQSA